MKVLLLSLLLYAVGLNQMLARVIPWNSYEPASWWNDDDFDSFNSPSTYFSDDFDKLTNDKSSEESKLARVSSTNEDFYEIGSFLGAALGAFLHDDDPVTNYDQPVSSDIQTGIDDGEKNHNNNNDDDDNNDKDDDENNDDAVDEPVVHYENDNETTNQFGILLYNPSTNTFEAPETKSSEENESSNEQENKSSEENFTSINAENKSDETRASETKSSEENVVKDITVVSEKEIKELTTLLLTLSAMDGLIQISNKYAGTAGWVPQDGELKIKEVDSFSPVLDSIRKELFVEKENDENDEKLSPTAHENESKDKSNEVIDNNNDKVLGSDNISDDVNSSDNNGNDINLISFEFHGFDGGDKPENLNDHKYEIVDPMPAFQPTTAPYIPEMAYSTNSDSQNVIQEYVEIREDLDSQQDSLQKNKFMLDKDFYAIISHNYDKESMNKFGKDIYQVHENLDRIKRSLDSMQNLNSKLYFHRLLTAAIKDIQNKSMN